MRHPLLLLLCLFLLPFRTSAQDPSVLDSLQSYLKKSIPDSARVYTLAEIGYQYQDAGNDSLCDLYLTKALETARRNGFKRGEAGMLVELGHNLRVKGKFEQMKENWTEAEKIYQEIRDTTGLAQIFYAWGRYNKDIGNYEKSVSNFFSSIAYFEKMKDEFHVNRTYADLANLYRKMGYYQKALNYYRIVYQAHTSLDDKSSIAIDLNNMGLIYSDLHDYAQSIYYLNKAIEVKKELGNDNAVASSLNILGTVYSDLKDYKKALDILFQALKLKEKVNDQNGVAISCVNIGDIYSMQKKYNDAITYYNRSVKGAVEMQNIDLLKEAYKGLANAYAGIHDMGNAYAFQLKYTDIKDSMFNESSTREMAEMQTKYETEKKEQENKLLQAQNEISSSTIHQQRVVSVFIAVGLVLALMLAFFIFRGYRQKQKANEIILLQKEEVEKQKNIIEEKSGILEIKNKEITDSIHYAKRIQRALLSSDNYMKKVLPPHFVLYKPKDIVSGDFYWCLKHKNLTFLAVADCTGHGVPGAFMSLVGISFLNEILIEKKIVSPEKILDQLRLDVIKALNPEDSSEESKDGMDIVLCCFDESAQMLHFAAANNSLYLIRDQILTEFKADKFPVGKYGDNMLPFTLQSIPLQPGDRVYCFTDGYADQFGGPKGKKFKYKQLQQLLLTCHQQPAAQQKIVLESAIESWKGKLEQVDDILLIGIEL